MLCRVAAALPLFASLTLLFGCPEAKAPDALLCIDRLSVKLVPPAGIKVEFRLLDCDGNPVRQLTPSDVSVINDEKGLPFGQGGEGDSISDIGENSAVELYSVLTLDLSNSIGEDELRDAVIDGAKAFVQAVVTNQSGGLKHNVAIIAFGAPSQVTVEQNFTQDDVALNAKLEELRGSPMRGSTDLYGAYTLALDTVGPKGTSGAIVERFVVLMTDGTHEAGDEENRRNLALKQKNGTEATVYSIGIQGNYDSCKLEELAGYQDKGGCRVGSACVAGTAAPAACINFISDVSQANLEAAFASVAEKAAALARSNYAVGICTPVAFGNPSLTLELSVDGRVASESGTYPAEGNLTGDVNNCNAGEIQAGVLACSGAVCAVVCGGMQCGEDQGVSCGTCPERFMCNVERQCEAVCVGMACGTDQGVSCGTCGASQVCQSSNLCQDVCVGMDCGSDQGVDCGTCDASQYCATGNVCTTPCQGMNCGSDQGVSCGACAGLQICQNDNTCLDVCVGMDCGSDQGIACGTCGATQVCQLDNTCLDVCVGMDCGIDQGVDCGICIGGDYCGPDNVCIPPCANMDCGSDQGANCGTCAGIQYCGPANICVDPCDGMTCGTDQGTDCGTCEPQQLCQPDNTCLDVCIGMQCGTDQGVDCGTCGPQQLCQGDNTCLDVCLGMQCGTDQGVDCGDCGALAVCQGDNTCLGVCVGMQCGTDQGVGCGTCGPQQVCQGDNTCLDVCLGMQCGTDQGVDCGDCGALAVCQGDNTCLGVCVGMDCGMDQAVACGTCGALQVCQGDNTCMDVCVGMDCGTDQGVACGTCGALQVCQGDNTCMDVCVGMDCGTDQGVACGTCGALQICQGGGTCTDVCVGMECGTDQGLACGTCPSAEVCQLDNTCLSCSSTFGSCTSTAACECLGCDGDQVCTAGDDCLGCHDCGALSYCQTTCDSNGVCDPYNEGCACADCAQHPSCTCDDCDANATCLGPGYCICNTGYIGNGASCAACGSNGYTTVVPYAGRDAAGDYIIYTDRAAAAYPATRLKIEFWSGSQTALGSYDLAGFDWTTCNVCPYLGYNCTSGVADACSTFLIPVEGELTLNSIGGNGAQLQAVLTNAKFHQASLGFSSPYNWNLTPGGSTHCIDTKNIDIVIVDSP